MVKIPNLPNLRKQKIKNINVYIKKYYFIFLYKMIIIIIIAVILAILAFMILNLRKLNEKVIFYPPKKTIDEYKNACNDNNYCIPHVIKNDHETLYGLLYNKNKIPSFDDTIFLYSHGNAGWIGYLLHNNVIKTLSNYGSVFLYDYSGYGSSSGIPSEKEVYHNIETVWKYLTETKNVKPKNIIVYGQSLGCAVSSNLVSNLCQNKKILPKLLILEAPFINIKAMAKQIGSLFSSENVLSKIMNFLVVSKFDNLGNLECAENKIPVYIFHSPFDEIVPYQQGKELAEKTKANLVKINGGHNDAELSQEALDVLQRYT
jgi:uncharacterized protein